MDNQKKLLIIFTSILIIWVILWILLFNFVI